MKIALCHLEISRGPEHKNIELLENAVRIAADNGAKWVVTPETAVQGYYFYKLNPDAKVIFISAKTGEGFEEWLDWIRNEIQEYKNN